MSSAKKKVLAAVVTYNRKELLLECLAALVSQTVSCDILVIDNASTDGTGNLVFEFTEKNNGHKIIYHNMGWNTGGTGGFNFAARYCAEKGYAFAWLMDDDCVAYHDALEKLLEADYDLGGTENYGFLASEVLWTDGSVCKMNRPKFIDGHLHNGKPLADRLRRISQSSFVSLFLPSSTIKKAGLPVKDFFIWGDDIEYTRRISVRMNMPCYFVPQSKAVHKMNINNGSSLAVDTKERLPRYVYAFRNECFLYRQEGVLGVCFYILRCAKSFAKIILMARNLKIKRCATLFEGVMQGINFKPKIEML